MPEGAVYVGRPTKWGNPYRVGAEPYDGDGGQTLEEALYAYRHLTVPHLPVAELRGKDLACWCPLVDKDGHPVPCHADVLLEIANG